MKSFLILGQLLVLITWIITNRNFKATAKQISNYKHFAKSILINAWMILFILQILSGEIFKFGNNENIPIQIIGLSLYFSGVVLAIWAKITLGRNWGLPMQHDVDNQKELVIVGPYKFSRNPIYLSELIMLTGFEIALQSWLILLVIPFTIFNYIKIIKEEKYLMDAFGKKYITYLEKVPRFF